MQISGLIIKTLYFYLMKFEKYIFICINQREANHPRGCCSAKGSDELVSKFKELIKSNGLKMKVRANKSGCLDCCELGPNVLIHPDNIWYSHVKLADVSEIFNSHILKNQPVTRLLSDFSMYKGHL